MKTDVSIAKKCLSGFGRRESKTENTHDNATRLDLFLEYDDRKVLQDAGKITAEIAKNKAETEFEKYRIVQDRLFESDFDKLILKQLENRGGSE